MSDEQQTDKCSKCGGWLFVSDDRDDEGDLVCISGHRFYATHLIERSKRVSEMPRTSGGGPRRGSLKL